MEYWDVTKHRAQLTQAAWVAHMPALKIGTYGTAELGALVALFEPRVQERTLAQDDYDAAFRAVQAALLKMKILGTKLPVLIAGQLSENDGLMKDVNDLYRTTPKTEATTLKRARELIPVWQRANTAMAALTPAQPAITRTIQGTAYTAAMLKALLDGYTDIIGMLNTKQEALDKKRTALRTLDHEVDQLNKRWYKVVKASYDPGSAEYESLSGIPTEQGTPAPDEIEIDNVLQGGEEGRQALVSYLPGGGDHATTKKVKWKIAGVDTDFTNEAPLDASGIRAAGRAFRRRESPPRRQVAPGKSSNQLEQSKAAAPRKRGRLRRGRQAAAPRGRGAAPLDCSDLSELSESGLVRASWRHAACADPDRRRLRVQGWAFRRKDSQLR